MAALDQGRGLLDGGRAQTVPAPPLVLYEREAEWSALWRALADAAASHGRLVFVEGSPGIGKTRLLEALRAAVNGSDVCLLTARGIEMERDFSFGICLQLFERTVLGATEAERTRLFAGAAALAAPLFGADGATSTAHGEAGHSLAHGLFWLACNITEARRASVLLVDDVQWCDAGSLAFLAYLAERLEDLAITLVVAMRSGEPGTPQAVTQIRSRAAADAVLRPGPFSRHTVELRVRDAFPDAASEFVDACAHVSGGNPFLLGELLRSLEADAITPTAKAAVALATLVPETVLASVVGRLGRLPESAVALARSAAVLGAGASMRLAGTLAGLDPHSTTTAADILANAHILEPGEPLSFTHPLIASAVEADLPAGAAARAHRGAAVLIAADDGPIESVAAHLLASPGEGEEWAVDVLSAAAERASAVGDAEAASRLLARALEEPPTEDQRPRILLALAYAETAAGSAEAPDRMTGAVALVADPRERAAARRASARLLLARARYVEAADSFERGLAELPPDDPLAEEMLADLLAVWFFLPGRRAMDDPRLSPLLARVRGGRDKSDPSLLAPVAATLALQGCSVDLVRPYAEASLAALAESENVSHGVLSAFAIAALLYVDELDLAERAVEAELERANRRGSAVAYAIACHWRARIAYRRGRLAESAASAQEALDLGRDRGWTAAILAGAAIERGELDQAGEAIVRVERADRGGFEHAFLCHVRGLLALARGDDAAALEDLEAGGDHLLEQFGFDNPIMLGWREPAVLASLRLGDVPGAGCLADASVSRAEAFDSPGIRGAAMRVAGLAAGGERGIEMLRRSAEVLERSPAVLERARTLVDLGSALRRAGQSSAAMEPLRRGLALADACGADPLAERAGEELRATGARPRRAAISGVDSLTPRELRVANLASQGLTNKQIAQALFITTKTVESHLQHAYQKLNLRSRDELKALLIVPASATAEGSRAG